MFQSFEDLSAASAVRERVARLRQMMARRGVDAVLVPRADAWQGEYVTERDERLRWISGFTGSAGLAIVTRSSAALFVDGRYTLQARAQTDTAAFSVESLVAGDWMKWLAGALPQGGTIGFDPWLHTIAAIEAARTGAKRHGITLKALPANLVDAAWGRERPQPAPQPIVVHPMTLAGVAPAEKIAAAQKALAEDAHDAVVLTLPDSICWLLNIRGADVAHTPIVQAFAIVPAKGKPVLFVDPVKVTGDAKRHLAGLVRLEEPDALGQHLAAMRKDKRKVRVDHQSAAAWFKDRLGPACVAGSDPCVLAKARKNPVEIAGARAAHVRDGAAIVRYLAWLDQEALKGKLDEITAVARLEELRAASQKLKDISFDTISGSGPNGAIVHYRVTRSTNRALKPGELFLVDSGAQYADGTTDITRTIVIGKPTAEMRRHFSLVLKAHIRLATARFPAATRGVQLDALARDTLWRAGLDYDHGTGHGIGSYLSVHEGPQSISKRGMAELEPGMIVSNEPGYYREGAYGIRLENLMVVTDAADIEDGERKMLGFETLTLAPFDRRLVDVKLLDAGERAWLDAYHREVMARIGPEVPPDVRAWLEKATAPLK